MSKPQDTKKRTFNLAEHYLLSCLDHGGRFLTQPHTVRVGIAGAMLTDLARRGHIHVSQELVTIADPTIGDLEPPVHSVLHLIAESPQPQDAEQWINRFSRPALMDVLLKILEHNGQLTLKKKRLMGLIPQTRYLPNDSYGTMDSYIRMRATLMGRPTQLEAITWPLIQLLYSTNVLTRVFPAIANKTIRLRLRQFHEEIENTQPDMAEALQAVENAIAESLTATRGQATGLRG